MKSMIFAAGLCISTIAYAQTTGSGQSGSGHSNHQTTTHNTQPMAGKPGTMGSGSSQERWGTTTPMQRGTMGQQNQPMQGSQSGQWGQSSAGNGMTGTDRGMGGPAMNQGSRDYPRCSRTVRDSCTQIGPRG